MLYFANPTSNNRTHEAMKNGDLGFIDTPGQGFRHVREPGVKWCADNGCFNDARFDEQRWWKFLQDNAYAVADCAFATAPDVLGDHLATIERSAKWLPKIRSLGYPAAFVAQDGATPETLPWDDFDVLFIGGTNKFKLGDGAIALMRAAKERGMWVHVGRVNSRSRYLKFASLKHKTTNGEVVDLADSCDGTYLIYGPDVNLPKLLSWINEHKTRDGLFPVEDLKW